MRPSAAWWPPARPGRGGSAAAPRADRASAGVWDAAPARWGVLPAPATVVRVSFWVRDLAPVLDALAAAGAAARVRPAVSGPARAGALYACLDPGAADDAAARFVTMLREQVAGCVGSRGAVVVLAP